MAAMTSCYRKVVSPMSDPVIVALISGAFTLVGTILGVVASAKMTNYRIEQLEKKVEKHNNVVERTYKLEGRMNEAEHDLKDLKKYHQPH